MFWGFTLSIKVASRKAQKRRSCGSSLGQVHTSCQSACPEFRTAKSRCIMCVQYIRGCSVHLLGLSSGAGPSAAALAIMKQKCATIFVREIGNFCGGEYSTLGEC